MADEKLFSIETYRTDEKKEREGVVCFISGLGEDGPGFRVRSITNNPDYAALDRRLSVAYHEQITSPDPKVVSDALKETKIKLVTETLITEAVRFAYPGTTTAWEYTPESGFQLFSKPGYAHLVDLLIEFASRTSNYRFEEPTDAQAKVAAEAVKTPSSSGKRTRRSKSKA